MSKKKLYIKAFIFIAILFSLFGGLTVFVQLLLPYLRDIFELNYTHTGLIALFFFLPYLLFSIPAGFILTKIGYRRGIILGLALIALGALFFHPAADERSFSLFMIAIFILGSGITFLQVAVNPYVAILGSETTTPSRLTFSQAFNALGTTLAPIAAAVYLLKDEVKTTAEINQLNYIDRSFYFEEEALAIQIPSLYIALGAIALALIFSVTKLPYINLATEEEVNKENYFPLLKKNSLLLGAIGIFLYVGAEVVIGGFAVNYFVETNIEKEILESPSMSTLLINLGKILNSNLTSANPKAIVAIFLTFYWGSAMIGRFIGAYLTKVVAPAKVLMLFSAIVILLILISINTDGLLSMWSLLLIGLFNSIMFPTIFALSSEGLEMKTQSSAILCTMIVGGGFIPLLYGFFTDYVGFRLAFLTLVVCYSYIAFLGFYKNNR
ncbi:sugar MFS transporter [Capnocytophaga leadbetteri]|uniref:sugar MFS transporter n=1 Tax=Capnocytophaga leadbetteri TaxID=327575 RepID=UPI0028E7179E|nr:sugar MFS transporter [Capnocytophaga leadbetteri]